MKETELDILQTIETMQLDIAQLKKLLQPKAEPEKTIDYKVNWDNAPEWALAHAYDQCGEGYWYGPHNYRTNQRFGSYVASGYEIGSSVMEIHKKIWMKSITLKPLYF